MLNHVQAYHSFLTASQMGDFETAEKCRDCSVAMLESAMDAFIRVCRAQTMSDGQNDGEY